ncbi:MAG TPA: SufD family Fe-S cluster assembly protein [Candidatus Dojkabacteria bacterium]|nr:SufD family Fe-S cluster assembly protein [Candidatus Dojkabacteria bacterium]HRP36715.1 SufD family Fe-S cluster assembly protein [Candidatus Dojkabacteria bacterium]HRP51459.1 SufD family Fe-S cluster assembly protein [Candidatus Dojkabacteria bacterium]
MKTIILDLTKPKIELLINEDTEIYGVFVGKKDMKLKTELTVIHTKPNLKSLTIVKAVVFDKSSFDMIGNLVINTGAKYTDAYLRLDALIMSADASARVIPSLEITENDVKGGHGATVGQVNQDQLFYLQSRGLNKTDAESLLVDGFLSDINIKITNSS